MIEVTFDNYEQFLVGTPVEFNFGAMYPIRTGKIIGWEVTPKTKYFGPDIFLVAEYTELNDDGYSETLRTTVKRFVEATDSSPIGCRLL